ncbi:MAG: hypothetical protein QM692_04650 [Thermomicrobiales bacterium]
MTECQGCGAWNERHRTLCVLCGAPLAEVDEWGADAEPLPLPPLPDGGLRASMPAWLRDVPAADAVIIPEKAGDDEEALTPEEALSREEALTPSPSPDARERGADQTEPLVDTEPAWTATPHEAAAESHSPAHRERGWGEGSPTEPPLGPTADPRTFLRDEDFPRWLRELPPLPPRPPRPERSAFPEPVVIAVVEPAPIPEPVTMAEAPPESALPAVEPAPTAPVATAAPPPGIATAPRRPAWEQALLALLGLAIVVAVVWALIANGLIGGV